MGRAKQATDDVFSVFARTQDPTERRRAMMPEIARLVRSVLDHRPCRIILFGSVARGEAQHISDIDIALDAGERLDGYTMFQIRDALEESLIPYRIDVLDLAAVSPEMRAHVLKEGIVWNG
ncbi:MAG: nucleotidyltransferase domain-containing protein [Thermoflavifilum sp.]|nr:nucleotidyltransferase domain-containing protein [Thermoflavifilum sp.]